MLDSGLQIAAHTRRDDRRTGISRGHLTSENLQSREGLPGVLTEGGDSHQPTQTQTLR